MKTLLKSVILVSCLVLIAIPVRAQVPGIDLRLNPRIGLYEPLNDLAEFQAAGESVVAEQGGSLALGLGLEVDLAMLPVGVRLNLDYATGSDIQVTSNDVDLGDPIETTLLAVVGDVIFRPLPRVVVVQPYLFAGGGLKQYDVDEGTTATEFESESDPTIHLGGGIDFGLGPLALNAELGDYISWYEITGTDGSEVQHDLFVTIGFSIGLL
ncbi:MAG: hypothetical protein ACLFRX_02740 [Gemmatimonadota bacterium]